MQKIRVLDDAAINKIAAGEVVADPASVVKELVENALDAKSRKIAVDIKQGGRSLIRITDDGEGMSEEDAVLAFERHATSKISSFDDLYNLSTMGFRGEAIPSIAAVSKCTLITRRKEKEKGTLVVLEGGRMTAVKEASACPGTEISIRDLFFNVPVRRKFQKSPQKEFQDIVKVVEALALSQPLVHFRLTHNDALIFNTEKCAVVEDDFSLSLKNRLAVFFEEGIKWHDVGYRRNDKAVFGSIAEPAFSRPQRSGQYLFVNGRFVTSPFISNLIKESFGTSIEEKRHPVFVLHLHLPMDEVDVNVHPQKKEVRFRSADELRSLIVTGVKKALSEVFAKERQDLGLLPFERSSDIFRLPTLSLETKVAPEEKAATDWSCFFSDEKELFTPTVLPQHSYEQELPLAYASSSPRVLAMMPGYFIIEGVKEHIAIVDQNRAFSRILFESAEKNSRDFSQLALAEEAIPLSLEESLYLEDKKELLFELGLELKENTLYSKYHFSSSLRDVFESLFHEKKLSFSYKGARKLLHKEEGAWLLDRLLGCRDPFFDPKGRPIFVWLSEDSLARLFS